MRFIELKETKSSFTETDVCTPAATNSPQITQPPDTSIKDDTSPEKIRRSSDDDHTLLL
jgi:hypothetical protein